MATATVDSLNEPFLKHLNVRKTPYIFLTAETDDFDEEVLQQWQAEGFVTTYVPLNGGGQAYVRRLRGVADDVVGLSDQYAIVAYGDAASACLEAHIKSAPRLCALIAYYPSKIPDPSQTKFAMHTSVLVHLAGAEIGVSRNPEILGIQGKRKTVRKRVDAGIGLGGEMKLSYPCYKYEGVEPGFAEHDLDEYDAVAEGIAWSRSLNVVRRAFGLSVDIERIRDKHLENTTKNVPKALETTSNEARILYTPTLTGGISPSDLKDFYTEFFAPGPSSLNPRLLSRTIGVDRVVDEINLSFNHNQEITWLLPGIPPTNRRIEITVVSIVCVKGGVLAHEHVYWDQASVLVQTGLLDPGNVPQRFGKEGVRRLPVVGAESARAVMKGESKGVNDLIEEW